MNLAVTFIIALVFWFLDSACGDAAVSCVLLETCVLPCRFEPGPDPVIHWTKEPHDQTPVHIYYKGRSQLHIPLQNFTGRTSLFEEELSTGNASLRLSGVKVQDEGKYKCYANGVNKPNTDSYVDVFVCAPAPVSLQQQGQELLCRSEGVYPKPSVSWSPPSSAALTTVTPSEGGVWSVHSSVSLPHSPPHQYSCNVSNSRGSWRSATYRRNSVIYYDRVVSDYVIISCTEPSAPVKSLIWRFNQNQIILSRSGPESVYTESWRQFVVRVTESNSLILKNLTKEQLGLFSCELKTEQENFIILTEVTEGQIKGERLDLWRIIVSVLIPLVFVLIYFIVLLYYWKHHQGEPPVPQNPSSSHENGLPNKLNQVEPHTANRNRAEYQRSDIGGRHV